MAPSKGARAPGAGVPDEAAPLPEALRQEFAVLGLSPYECGVLLALLRLGSATTLQLAKVADVPRTSTYQVLEDLRAMQVPGDGAAVWASPGRDEVMDLLDAAEEERLAEHKARTARIRQLIAESFPESPSVGLPSVQLLASAAQMMAVFEQLLAEAEREFFMFTRPPYTWLIGNRNPVVLEALARGIRSRVLYQASEWEDPAAGAFRAEMEVYQRAGLEVRLMEEPPIKLVVVDHEAVLVAMTDPVGAGVSYPTTLFVQHPGFAKVQAEAFERYWTTGRPVPPACSPKEGQRPTAATTSSSLVLAAPRTGMRTDGRLSSAEAAAYLGVRRSTLHTYVSRGLLHSERQSDGRMSTFDAEELARFAATRRSRQKGQS